MPRALLGQILVENQPQGTGRGGRMIAITLDRANPAVAIAASPTGGLFKTVDDGATWAHIDALPTNRLWDVQIDPAHGNHVLATVTVDSHIPTYAGLWRSVDGGVTWTQPPGASAGYCDGTVNPDYARQIVFGPGATVFVGTDCGLAMSPDGGVTWARSTVAPGRPSVWSVAARAGAGPGGVIVDVCTSAGPRRSTDGGTSFGPTPATTSYPIGLCSVAESPSEPSVLFAASQSGGTGILWESDDGGATWTQLWSYSNPGRFAWVRTTVPPGAAAGRFDLYFHAGADLFRQGCITGATPSRCAVAAESGAACTNSLDDDGDGMVNEGCPAVGASEDGALSAFPPCKNAVDDEGDGVVNDGCPLIEYVGGGHDMGGIAFDATGCPAYLTSDFGVTRSTDCGVTWSWKNSTLGGLSIYDMAGTVLPDHTDLYFGTQDNYIWGSPDNGITWPWGRPSEGLWLQASHKASAHGVRLTGTVCASCNQLSWQDHGANETGWPPPGDQNPPPGGGPPFVIPGGVGPAKFLQLNDGTFWLRETGGAWRPFTPAVPNLATSELWVSGPPDKPTVYAVTDSGNVRRLLRVTGFAPGSSSLTVSATAATFGRPSLWMSDENPWKFPFVVAVDPSDGARLIAADSAGGAMLVSADSGKTWTRDLPLTNLVRDNGRLLFYVPYVGPQAHVIRYNPSNGRHVLVGTEAAGIIETCDAGQSWHVVPGSRRATAVSDFVFDETRRQVHVGTYGRGLWRIDYTRLPTRLTSFFQIVVLFDWLSGQAILLSFQLPPVTDPCWDPPTLTAPPTVVNSPPRLSIRVSVRPPGDPALVALAVDGLSFAPPAGDGFWSGWRTVTAGTHLVTAIIMAPPGAGYALTFGGDCSTGGVVLAANVLSQTCWVTATRQ